MSFTFRNVAIIEGNTNSFVCNKPSGTINGDIMFAFVTFNNAYSNSVPSGWNSLGQQAVSSYNRELFYKIANNEGDNYTWGFASSAYGRVTIAAFYDGFNTSNPIDVVSNTAYTTSNATVRAASMNVSAINSPLIFYADHKYPASCTFTKPSVPTSDWVEHYDGGSSSSTVYSEVCSMVWSGSGATGNMDATGTRSSSNKHAFAVALNPPAASSSIKILDGLVVGSISTRNGLAKASMKTLNGLA